MKVKIVNLAVALALVISLGIVALPAAGAVTPQIISIDPIKVERGNDYTVEIVAENTAFNVYSEADFGGNGVVVHSTTPTSPTRVLAQISVSHAAALTKRYVSVKTGTDTVTTGMPMFEVIAIETCPQMSVVHWFVGDACGPCNTEDRWPLNADDVIGGADSDWGRSWNYAFATIQHAIDVAEARKEINACVGCPCPFKDEMSVDVIHVWPGIYQESIVISETLQIYSDDSRDDCEMYGGTPTMEGITTSNDDTIIQGCSPTVLIQAPKYSWYQGAGTEKTEVAHFEGFTVEGAETCAAVGVPVGIHAVGAVGAEIIDNIINATEIGIDAENSAHIQIWDNVVNVNNDHGVAIGIGAEDSPVAVIDGNTISIGCLPGDDFAPMVATGIMVDTSPGITVNENTVTVKAIQTAIGIQVQNSDSAKITCNIVLAQIVCDEICVDEGDCDCLYFEITQAWGIYVDNCKNVLIHKNDVDVLARAAMESTGVGIYVANSTFADVTENTVDVDVELTGDMPCAKNIFAAGIVLNNCLLADVILNVVNVDAECDAEGCEDPNCCPDCCPGGASAMSQEVQDIIAALAADEGVDPAQIRINLIVGIVAINSQSILIDQNQVQDVKSSNCPLTCAQCCRTMVFGILLLNCGDAELEICPGCLEARLSRVTMNTVTVTADAGICLLVGGIKACNCEEIIIDQNVVNVTGTLDGDVPPCNNNEQTTPGSSQQTVDAMMDGVLGLGEDAELALGIGFGIWVGGSDMNVVNANIVNVDMDVTVEDYDAEAEADALAAGGVAALGIVDIFSFTPMVINNQVSVNADVIAVAEEESGEANEVCALGGGVAIAIGIGAYQTAGIIIDNNTSQAYAQVQADVVDQIVCGGSLDDQAAIAQLDSEVMTTIYDIINETLTSDGVDAKMATNCDPIDTFALGGGLAVGIGILTIDCMSPMYATDANTEDADPALLPFMMMGAVITNNPIVIGQGVVTLDVGPTELLPGTLSATSAAGGLGLGVGIASVFCAPVAISDNGVTANGYGDAVVAAVDPWSNAQAAGLVGGAGVGIIVVSPIMTPVSGEEDAEDSCLFGKAIVSGNTVVALGDAYVLVGSYAGGLPSEACALAAGLGAGLGIVVIGFPGAEVIDNIVDADGTMEADAEAIALSGDDPYVIGAGAGIGVGIAVALCPFADVMANTVDAYGQALVDLGATENHFVEVLQAGGLGAGLGVGMGILVVGSPRALVGGEPDEGILGNTVGAKGDVAVNVITKDNQPLGAAWEMALGAGIGEGIVVVCSDHADIKNCNHVWGDGVARVFSEADGIYTCDVDLGITIDADIKVAFSDDVDAHYNSMLDPDVEGVNEGPVHPIDAGMLILCADVDAKYNFWNDPTGPSAGAHGGIFGMGYGWGEPLIVLCGEACFEPWLYVDHQQCLNSHYGKFGFTIKKCYCWNTFSTPISLNSEGDTWDEILANSGITDEVEIIYRYNPEPNLATPDPNDQIGWEQVTTGNDAVRPLEGFYVRMAKDARFILYTNDQRTFPMRQLYSGLNLIGPNPAFFNWGTPTDIAMASVVDNDNLAFVLSEAVGSGCCKQDGWVWAPSAEQENECMISGEAYWAFMNQGDILAGQGFTPVYDLYPDEEGCCK